MDYLKYIWEFNGEGIYKEDIINALKNVGLASGDIAMFHADLGVFGKIGEIKNRKKFNFVIIEAIRSFVGDAGALIVPAYTYSICKNQIFDIKNSKPKIGSFSEIAFELYQENLNNDLKEKIIRSDDPIFSCIGFGSKADLILSGLGSECFGDNSVFGRLYKHDAKLICFGFSPFAVTYMHYVEKCFDKKIQSLVYRKDINFAGLVIDEKGKEKIVQYKYFARDLNGCGEYNFHVIPPQLKKWGFLKEAKLGGGVITLSKSRNIYKVLFDLLKKDKFYFLDTVSRKFFQNEYK